MGPKIARVRFLDDKYTDAFIPTEDIWIDDVGLEKFQPHDDQAFKKDTIYSAFWCQCKQGYCNCDKSCALNYYDAYIYGLGDSREDILKKMEGCRIKLPKLPYESKDSSERSEKGKESSRKIQKQRKILARDLRAEKSLKTLSKFNARQTRQTVQPISLAKPISQPSTSKEKSRQELIDELEYYKRLHRENEAKSGASENDPRDSLSEATPAPTVTKDTSAVISSDQSPSSEDDDLENENDDSNSEDDDLENENYESVHEDDVTRDNNEHSQNTDRDNSHESEENLASETLPPNNAANEVQRRGNSNPRQSPPRPMVPREVPRQVANVLRADRVEPEAGGQNEVVHEEVPVPYKKFKKYKPNLYAQYLRDGTIDEANDVAENQEFEWYTNLDGKVYISNEHFFGIRTWDLMMAKKSDIFNSEVLAKIHKKDKLANRFLDNSKTSKPLPDQAMRSPRKRLTPKKVEVYLGAVEHYVNARSTRMVLDDDEKFRAISTSTATITNRIRDARKKIKESFEEAVNAPRANLAVANAVGANAPGANRPEANAPGANPTEANASAQV